jgi:hypothetical protein
MMWGEVNKWAKEKGFKLKRIDGLIHWHKLDDATICGAEENIDEVATAIFNVISDYKWVEYQKSYKPKT